MSNVNDNYFAQKYPVRPAQERSKMKLLLVVLLIAMAVGVVVAVPAVMLSKKSTLADSSENEVAAYDFPYVSRSEWNARPATEVLPLLVPVPYVVIHHSSTPAACYTRQECKAAMKSMQDFHMNGRHWWDIGYSFAVGSDGVAYEGRGWKILGAHALHFNTVSIGICVIGDWTNSIPPAEQLKTVKALIAAGVELGYIKPDYKLVGHRQVRETECPGQSFFDVVKTWDHWSPFPASHEDLVNVPEISDDYKNRNLNISVLKGNTH